MNELMHELINKFNNINIMCGTFALELKCDSGLINDLVRFKKKAGGLLYSMRRDINRSRQLLEEITATLTKESDFLHENEHFLKVIEPIMPIIEEKKLELENIINGNTASLPERKIIALLHLIEEKALACAIALRDLKSALIKSGRYKT